MTQGVGPESFSGSLSFGKAPLLKSLWPLTEGDRWPLANTGLWEERGERGEEGERGEGECGERGEHGEDTRLGTGL